MPFPWSDSKAFTYLLRRTERRRPIRFNWFHVYSHDWLGSFLTLAQAGSRDSRPVAFASQKLSGLQLGWAIIEKEAYAIICALNGFRDIVYGAHVTVFYDHNPLQNIRESATKSAKLLRWSLSLQEYDVEIKYTKGSHNVVADCLSRVWYVITRPCNVLRHVTARYKLSFYYYYYYYYYYYPFILWSLFTL